MVPDYLVAMVIKQSRVLDFCTGGTSGSILIGGDDGALMDQRFWGYCFKIYFIFGMKGGTRLNHSLLHFGLYVENT